MKITLLFSILVILGALCLHGTSSQPIFKILKKKFRKFVRPAPTYVHHPVQQVYYPVSSYVSYVPQSYGGHHHHHG